MIGVLDLTSGLLQANYRAQGQSALNHRQQALQQMMSQRQMPKQGWSDMYISAVLGELALMDSNNFVDSVGVGEREGRVFANLVRQRHSNLSHGMGRSGDLIAQQPKAAGSSLMLTLTHALTLHAIKLAGLTEAKQVLLLPVATGMSIVLTLTAIKQQHPRYLAQQKAAVQFASNLASSLASSSASAAASSLAPAASSPPLPPASPSPPLYVLWSRIDQKTCLKSIFASGLVPVVIELKQEGDQLVTDVAAMEAAVQRVGADNIVAIVSTTSCFAPRAPDKVVEISKLCARFHIAHVVNNAYGLQSASTCALINSAVRKNGRVDAVISSMDKNFLVPVGGAMVIGFNRKERKGEQSAQQAQQAKAKAKASAQPASNASSASSVAAASSTAAVASPAAATAPAASVPAVAPLPNVLTLISSLYPGRASSSSITDLFITLLSMGADGWLQLLREREALLPKFKARLAQLAAEHGERLLQTDDNPISFGMTLQHIEAASAAEDEAAAAAASASSSAPAAASKFAPSYLGSLLFSRNVSGPRVLSPRCASSTIHGLTFRHYGTHSDSYPHAYVTAACGIGMRESEVEAFAQRLDKCIKEFAKQRDKKAGGEAFKEQKQAAEEKQLQDPE